MKKKKSRKRFTELEERLLITLETIAGVIEVDYPNVSGAVRDIIREAKGV